MEKNSDYKHNLELALCDLDEFFLGCDVYSITSEDVFSTVLDHLFSYLGAKQSLEFLTNFLNNHELKGGVKHG